ncbi:uncharacterized protein LOC132648581 [Meriones unguiculatus]|uniref:uncharacterized protein LOC132648581 n=1 Tax=Meriones unguiculatus TaxID=10047 RepID=UPI00293EED27|nr:uncharacterized protein LOC132648581 [Meriones unguiculatus]
MTRPGHCTCQLLRTWKAAVGEPHRVTGRSSTTIGLTSGSLAWGALCGPSVRRGSQGQETDPITPRTALGPANGAAPTPQDAWSRGLCAQGPRAAPLAWASRSCGRWRPEPPAWWTGGRRGPAGSSAPPHRSLRSSRQRARRPGRHLLAMALPRSIERQNELCLSKPWAEHGRRGRPARRRGVVKSSAEGPGLGEFCAVLCCAAGLGK